jgi:hypothetical protein
VLEAIRSGELDAADVASPNLIDEIMLKMRQLGLLGDLAQALPDKRKANAAIPHEIVLFLMVAAKMKTRQPERRAVRRHGSRRAVRDRMEYTEASPVCIEPEWHSKSQRSRA